MINDHDYHESGPVTLPDDMAQPEVKCVGQVWYAIVCSTLKIDMLEHIYWCVWYLVYDQ